MFCSGWPGTYSRIIKNFKLMKHHVLFWMSRYKVELSKKLSDETSCFVLDEQIFKVELSKFIRYSCFVLDEQVLQVELSKISS